MWKKSVQIICIVILALIVGNGINITNGVINSDFFTVPQAKAAIEPDLTITDITWYPEQPKTGETVVISVSARNLGADMTSNCILVSTLDGTELVSATIAPIASGASVIQSWTWKAEPGKHTFLATIDARESIAESNESNNSAMVSFPVLAADLKVRSIEWSPQSPSIGDKVTFTVTVENIGDDTSAWSWAELLIDGSSRGQVEIGRIVPGATANANFYWMAREGEYTITALADPSAKVYESNESNNEKTVIYSTAVADLIVDSITWTPAVISEHSVVTFSMNLKNIGSGKSNSGWLAYSVDGQSANRIFCEQLNPDSTMTKTFTGAMGRGNHSVLVVADAGDDTAESIESNNEKEVSLSTFLPDFALFLVPWDSWHPGVGETVSVCFAIHNTGEATSSPSKITYYLDGKVSAEGAVTAIEPGSSVIVECRYTMKSTPVKFKAVVDAANLIRENDETNNTQELVLECDEGVDLVVAAISASSEQPATGEIVEIAITVKNIGLKQALSSQVALSVDSVELIPVQVKALNRDESAVAVFKWTALPGTHTIKAVADSYSWVNETKEDNNERTATIATQAPDFALTAVTMSPENPVPGEQLTFAVTLRNQGPLPAGMSSIQSLADGIIIGSDSVHAMSPGEACIFSFVWVMQSGSHSITFRVDSEGKILEMDENNNTIAVNFPLTALTSETSDDPSISSVTGDTVQTISNESTSETYDPDSAKTQNLTSISSGSISTTVPTQGSNTNLNGNEPTSKTDVSSAPTAAPKKIDNTRLFIEKPFLDAIGRNAWWVGILLVIMLMLIFKFGKRSNVN